MEQTRIFIIKFQIVLKLTHDDNQNNTNLYAEELYYTQTDKRKQKESKIKGNKLKKDRTISFQVIEEMNNNIFTTINEIDFDKIAVTNVDELCLEEYLKCNLIIDRKLRNIIIIFVTIVLLCNEPLEKQEFENKQAKNKK